MLQKETILKIMEEKNHVLQKEMFNLLTPEDRKQFFENVPLLKEEWQTFIEQFTEGGM